MNRIILTLLLITACYLQAEGQKSRAYRNYKNQEMQHNWLAQDPEYAKRLQNMEQYIQTFGTAPVGQMDTIPVVFHVLYAPGQWHPAENQIIAQLDTLNQYFTQYQPPENPYIVQSVQALTTVAVAPDIFFCLADFSEENPGMSAIQFIETANQEWPVGDDVKYSAQGGADAQFSNQALNIWVCYLPGETAGFAAMPAASASTDGIVLNTRFFQGSPDSNIQKIYGTGKSLVHLAGTYLGLYELWNEANPCADDYVEDTPLHNTPNYFPGDIHYHISLCDTLNKAEMIMNFMDNTDDEALNMFTQGQKNRMKAVLSNGGPRSALSSGSRYCSASQLIGYQDRSKKKKAVQVGLIASPNPAENNLSISFSSSLAQNVLCRVTNATGGLIWENTASLDAKKSTLEVDCSAWSNGVYYISAIFENGAVLTDKVLIASH